MSKICLTSIQHQIPVVIWPYCAQNSVSGLILYNRLNSIKSPCYFTLFESKSAAIFICFCCLIIFFKLHKFTQTLYRVFPSPNLNSYTVFH